MSEWIKVEDELPPEETEKNTLYFDVWINGGEYEGRDIGVKYKDGIFYEQILDSDGDISYQEEMLYVTHWLLPEPP